MDDQLFCPTCNKQIKIPDALMHKFIDNAKASLTHENKKKIEEALKEAHLKHEEETATLELKLKLKDEKLNESREKELGFIKEKEKLEQEKRDLNLEIERRTSEKIKGIYEQANKKFREEHKLELQKKEELIKSLKDKEEENEKILNEALKESEAKRKEEAAGLELKLKLKEDKLNESREKELQLLKDKEKLEQEKRDLNIEITRRTSEKAKEIYEQTNKKFNEEQLRKDEEHKLELREKEELINSLKDKNEEITKKLSQGSQQVQGEVQELEVADKLKKLYPNDIIEEIKKGADGSDVRQTVKSPLGRICGVILWESKRTKNWGSTWIEKLKKDLRREKADIPVLVTSILPKDVKTSVVFMDGIYICELGYLSFMSNALRNQVLAVAKQMAISQNKESKSVKIYDYVTSNNHIQLVQHKFMTYKRMREQLIKEHKVAEKLFKEREGQIEQLEKTDIEIYSSMAAQIGSSMPQLEDFQLEALSMENDIKHLSDGAVKID